MNLPLGFAGGIPYAFVLAVAGFSRNRGVVLGSALGCSFFILIGFLYSPAAVSPTWVVILNRLSALAVLGLLAMLFLRSITAEAERDQALRESARVWSEYRVLRGLIPICASCKRIRDSKGEWDALESYISEHSEASFTHSICADCEIALYPELSD